VSIVCPRSWWIQQRLDVFQPSGNALASGTMSGRSVTEGLIVTSRGVSRKRGSTFMTGSGIPQRTTSPEGDPPSAESPEGQSRPRSPLIEVRGIGRRAPQGGRWLIRDVSL